MNSYFPEDKRISHPICCVCILILQYANVDAISIDSGVVSVEPDLKERVNTGRQCAGAHIGMEQSANLAILIC